MTISTLAAKSRYAGDGTTVSFPTGFKFLDDAHVRVVLQAANGSERIWTEGSEYSPSGAGAPGGGSVEVLPSPVDHTPATGRSDERREGKACVGRCRCQWWASPKSKQEYNTI